MKHQNKGLTISEFHVAYEGILEPALIELEYKKIHPDYALPDWVN